MGFWQTYYHVVWGTKKREHIITDDRIELIRTSLTATALEHEAIVHAIGIMPDHIHVAITIPPKIAVSDLIGRMKGASSRRVNLTTGSAVEDGHDVHVVEWNAQLVDRPFALTRGFGVPAGSTIFNLVCAQLDGVNAVIWDPSLTAIFVPTRY